MTSELGHLLRQFKNRVCPVFETAETPEETAARVRWAAKRTQRTHCRTIFAVGRRRRIVSNKKTFNLSTYKIHALDDYPYHIRYFGTTDNYTTQRVSTILLQLLPPFSCSFQGEMEHRIVKRLHRRTNKNWPVKQIGKHVRRRSRLRRIAYRLSKYLKNPTPPKNENESLQTSNPDMPYHIGDSTKYAVDIPVWLDANKDDPAVKVC
jgi:hypothetical protein